MKKLLKWFTKKSSIIILCILFNIINVCGCGTGSPLNLDGELPDKIQPSSDPQKDKEERKVEDDKNIIKDDVQTVSLDVSHSAAITKDGSLYMWGNNSNGQLGNGTEEDSYHPIKIMDNVKSVCLKDLYSAAITKDGTLYLWGENRSGQLGNGEENIEKASTPIKIMDNVRTVHLGHDHGGAITEDGSLYMWGDNSNGKLGNGTEENSYRPIKIMDDVLSIEFTENFSAVITKKGELYTWGSNDVGQLGNGTEEDCFTPVKIMEEVKDFYSNGYSSAAITRDGSLYTWGSNDCAQLGNDSADYLAHPKPVKIMEHVVSMCIGPDRSAAIMEDGSLYIWGHALLGDGTEKGSMVPKKIMDDVLSITLGEFHSIAVKRDGSIYTWGYGDLNLGLDDGFNEVFLSYEPRQIKTVDNIIFVNAGYEYTGAVTKDGSLYMWGSNRYGQIGTGEENSCGRPVKIMDDILIPETYNNLLEEVIVNNEDSLENKELLFDISETKSSVSDDLHLREEDSVNAEYQDYVLPNSSSSYLDQEDIKGLSAEELRIARNEIYARHGRRFQSQDLQEYFESKDWYHGTIEPSDFKESVLNDLEKKNLELIKKMEENASAFPEITNLPDAPSKTIIDGYGYENGYSTLSFQTIEGTLEDCGGYFQIDAVYRQGIEAPKDLREGEQVTLVFDGLTGETKTLTYHDDRFYPAGVTDPYEAYYHHPSSDGRLVVLYQDSDDRVEKPVYEGRLYIRKDATKEVDITGQVEKVTEKELDVGYWYNGVYFDQKGYVTRLVIYGD